MAGSAKDSQRWIADEESIQNEMQIHRTANYGTNLRSVTEALEAQRERNNLVVSYEKDVNKLSKDAREAVTDSYDTLRIVSEKRLNCLEDIASIAGLEDILGKLSVEFATKASSLVASECNRQEFVPENAGDGIKAAAQNCILAVRDNWMWISKLVKCTDSHLKNSSEYHEFFHEVKENEAWMPVELKAAQNKVKLHETTEGNSREGQRWLLDIKELLTLFLHWQGKLEKLFERSKKIVPVNLRTKKLDYYRPVESLVPYKTSEIDVREGEELLLIDNSNTQSWMVRNHNSVESKVPSVICLIPGPDPDAMQAAMRLRFQLLTEWTLCIKRVGKSLILFNILVLKDWNNDEIKKLQAIPKEKKTEIVRILEFLLESLRPNWTGYAGFTELERRVGKMKDILKKDGSPRDRDQDFERELLARLGALEGLFNSYGTMWSQWEAYKILVEASRHADNLLIVDKWQQLKFINMDELRKLWQQSLEFGDGDNMDFESWLKRMMELWSRKVHTDSRDGNLRLAGPQSLEQSSERTGELSSEQSSSTSYVTTVTTEQTMEDMQGRLGDLDSKFNMAERRQQELLEQLESKRLREAELRDQEMRERERRDMERMEEETRLMRLREEEERMRRLKDDEDRLLRERQEQEERERSDWEVREERTVTTKTVREPAGLRTGQEYNMVEESYETTGMLGKGRNGFEEAELETTTQTSSARETATTDQVTHAEQEEKKTFVITGVIDPRTGEEVSMHQAVMLGIINSQEGTYVNPDTRHSIPIPEAMSEGHIKVEFTTSRKTQEKRRDVGLITIRTQRESRPYTVRSVIDAKTDDTLSVDDAIRRRILDQKNGVYFNTLTEQDMSLADALDSGLLIVEYDNNAIVADPEVVSKTYSIHGVVDQRRRAKVSFSDAIRSGLLNRETGAYYHNVDREYIYVGDAIKRGFIKASLVKDPNSLDIDPENRVVVETLETMKRKLLNPLKTMAAFKKAADDAVDNTLEEQGNDASTILNEPPLSAISSEFKDAALVTEQQQEQQQILLQQQQLQQSVIDEFVPLPEKDLSVPDDFYPPPEKDLAAPDDILPPPEKDLSVPDDSVPQDSIDAPPDEPFGSSVETSHLVKSETTETSEIITTTQGETLQSIETKEVVVEQIDQPSDFDKASENSPTVHKEVVKYNTKSFADQLQQNVRAHTPIPLPDGPEPARPINQVALYQSRAIVPAPKKDVVPYKSKKGSIYNVKTFSEQLEESARHHIPIPLPEPKSSEQKQQEIISEPEPVVEIQQQEVISEQESVEEAQQKEVVVEPEPIEEQQQQEIISEPQPVEELQQEPVAEQQPTDQQDQTQIILPQAEDQKQEIVHEPKSSEQQELEAISKQPVEEFQQAEEQNQETVEAIAAPQPVNELQQQEVILEQETVEEKQQKELVVEPQPVEEDQQQELVVEPQPVEEDQQKELVVEPQPVEEDQQKELVVEPQPVEEDQQKELVVEPQPVEEDQQKELVVEPQPVEEEQQKELVVEPQPVEEQQQKELVVEPQPVEELKQEQIPTEQPEPEEIKQEPEQEPLPVEEISSEQTTIEETQQKEVVVEPQPIEEMQQQDIISEQEPVPELQPTDEPDKTQSETQLQTDLQKDELFSETQIAEKQEEQKEETTEPVEMDREPQPVKEQQQSVSIERTEQFIESQPQSTFDLEESLSESQLIEKNEEILQPQEQKEEPEAEPQSQSTEQQQQEVVREPGPVEELQQQEVVLEEQSVEEQQQKEVVEEPKPIEEQQQQEIISEPQPVEELQQEIKQQELISEQQTIEEQQQSEVVVEPQPVEEQQQQEIKSEEQTIEENQQTEVVVEPQPVEELQQEPVPDMQPQVEEQKEEPGTQPQSSEQGQQELASEPQPVEEIKQQEMIVEQETIVEQQKTEWVVEPQPIEEQQGISEEQTIEENQQTEVVVEPQPVEELQQEPVPETQPQAEEQTEEPGTQPQSSKQGQQELALEQQPVEEMKQQETILEQQTIEEQQQTEVVVEPKPVEEQQQQEMILEEQTIQEKQQTEVVVEPQPVEELQQEPVPEIQPQMEGQKEEPVSQPQSSEQKEQELASELQLAEEMKQQEMILEQQTIEEQQQSEVVVEPQPVEEQQQEEIISEQQTIEENQQTEVVVEPHPVEELQQEPVPDIQPQTEGQKEEPGTQPQSSEQGQQELASGPQPVEEIKQPEMILQQQTIEEQQQTEVVVEPKPVEEQQQQEIKSEQQTIEENQQTEVVVEPQPVEELQQEPVPDMQQAEEQKEEPGTQPRSSEQGQQELASEPQPVEEIKQQEIILEQQTIEEQQTEVVVEPKPVEEEQQQEIISEQQTIEEQQQKEVVVEPQEQQEVISEPRSAEELQQEPVTLLEATDLQTREQVPEPQSVEQQQQEITSEPTPNEQMQKEEIISEQRRVEEQQQKEVVVEPQPVEEQQQNEVVVEPQPVEEQQQKEVVVEPQPVVEQQQAEIISEPQAVEVQQQTEMVVEPHPVKEPQEPGKAVQSQESVSIERSEQFLESKPLSTLELSQITTHKVTIGLTNVTEKQNDDIDVFTDASERLERVDKTDMELSELQMNESVQTSMTESTQQTSLQTERKVESATTVEEHSEIHQTIESQQIGELDFDSSLIPFDQAPKSTRSTANVERMQGTKIIESSTMEFEQDIFDEADFASSELDAILNKQTAVTNESDEVRLQSRVGFNVSEASSLQSQFQEFSQDMVSQSTEQTGVVLQSTEKTEQSQALTELTRQTGIENKSKTEVVLELGEQQPPKTVTDPTTVSLLPCVSSERTEKFLEGEPLDTIEVPYLDSKQVVTSLDSKLSASVDVKDVSQREEEVKESIADDQQTTGTQEISMTEIQTQQLAESELWSKVEQVSGSRSSETQVSSSQENLADDMASVIITQATDEATFVQKKDSVESETTSLGKPVDYDSISIGSLPTPTTPKVVTAQDIEEMIHSNYDNQQTELNFTSQQQFSTSEQQMMQMVSQTESSQFQKMSSQIVQDTSTESELWSQVEAAMIKNKSNLSEGQHTATDGIVLSVPVEPLGNASGQEQTLKTTITSVSTADGQVTESVVTQQTSESRQVQIEQMIEDAMNEKLEKSESETPCACDLNPDDFEMISSTEKFQAVISSQVSEMESVQQQSLGDTTNKLEKTEIVIGIESQPQLKSVRPSADQSKESKRLSVVSNEDKRLDTKLETSTTEVVHHSEVCMSEFGAQLKSEINEEEFKQFGVKTTENLERSEEVREQSVKVTPPESLKSGKSRRMTKKGIKSDDDKSSHGSDEGTFVELSVSDTELRSAAEDVINKVKSESTKKTESSSTSSDGKRVQKTVTLEETSVTTTINESEELVKFNELTEKRKLVTDGKGKELIQKTERTETIHFPPGTEIKIEGLEKELESTTEASNQKKAPPPVAPKPKGKKKQGEPAKVKAEAAQKAKELPKETSKETKETPKDTPKDETSTTDEEPMPTTLRERLALLQKKAGTGPLQDGKKTRQYSKISPGLSSSDSQTTKNVSETKSKKSESKSKSESSSKTSKVSETSSKSSKTQSVTKTEVLSSGSEKSMSSMSSSASRSSSKISSKSEQKSSISLSQSQPGKSSKIAELKSKSEFKSESKSDSSKTDKSGAKTAPPVPPKPAGEVSSVKSRAKLFGEPQRPAPKLRTTKVKLEHQDSGSNRSSGEFETVRAVPAIAVLDSQAGKASGQQRSGSSSSETDGGSRRGLLQVTPQNRSRSKSPGGGLKRKYKKNIHLLPGNQF